jgi:hypothetical protein
VNTPTNKHGADVCSVKPHTETTSSRNFSGKSTSVEAQHHRIIGALREGPKTSYDLRCLGCYQAPARVKELRDKFNFDIHTELVTLYDADGYAHPRAARYHLREVAAKSGVTQ